MEFCTLVSIDNFGEPNCFLKYFFSYSVYIIIVISLVSYNAISVYFCVICKSGISSNFRSINYETVNNFDHLLHANYYARH